MFRNILIFVSVTVLSYTPVAADWIQESISPHCSEEARNRVAQNTRNQIESAVRRAEAAIEPPAATGELSCLDGLMNLPLDQFAPTGELVNLFSSSLDGVVSNGVGERPICRFAKRKWREVTRPVISPLSILRRGLPPDLGNSFRGGQGQSNTSTDQSSNQSSSNSKQTDEQIPNTDTSKSNDNSSRQSDPIESIWRSLYGYGGTK